MRTVMILYRKHSHRFLYLEVEATERYIILKNIKLG